LKNKLILFFAVAKKMLRYEYDLTYPSKCILGKVKRAGNELGPIAILNVKELGSRNYVTNVSLLYGKNWDLAQNIINIFFHPKK